MSKKNVEKTLVLFKPDSMQRGLVGEILTRFERVGLRIVGTKMLAPDRDHYYKHYEDIGKLKTRAGDQIFGITLDMMSAGPVIAMVFEGVEAVSLVRKLVGTTEPKSSAPGTIRGDYSHMSYGYADAEGKGIPNLIHASGDPEEAEQEIAHWFSDEELFDYEALHEKFTR
ncbi:MAG TPA: nucleoside-diphosphate kinase [Candidatus Saccharibacteria bacterium]|nr:nucleoside-diphosphate kinase [Candidatus Saccharibacteria bacterium]